MAASQHQPFCFLQINTSTMTRGDWFKNLEWRRVVFFISMAIQHSSLGFKRACNELAPS
jgi:hypothetical protein